MVLEVLGIDGSPDMIEQAKKMSKAVVCTYEDLPSYPFNEKFDCIVCNFSLIGKEATELVVNTVASLLTSKGRFIIQTLHPVISCSDLPYQDGWRNWILG